MFAYKLNKCNICLAFTDSDTKEISDEQITENEPSYSVEDITQKSTQIAVVQCNSL